MAGTSRREVVPLPSDLNITDSPLVHEQQKALPDFTVFGA